MTLEMKYEKPAAAAFVGADLVTNNNAKASFKLHFLLTVNIKISKEHAWDIDALNELAEAAAAVAVKLSAIRDESDEGVDFA